MHVVTSNAPATTNCNHGKSPLGWVSFHGVKLDLYFCWLMVDKVVPEKGSNFYQQCFPPRATQVEGEIKWANDFLGLGYTGSGGLLRFAARM